MMSINLSAVFINAFSLSLLFLVKHLAPLLVIGLVVLIIKLYKIYRFKKAGMNEIDNMNGTEFEKFLALFFQKIGYQVKQVGSPSGDYGADLIITKDNESIAIQAKRHSSIVGIDAVREALGSVKMYNCTRCIVVTNNYFTKQAKLLAKINNVGLWDRNILTRKILISQS